MRTARLFALVVVGLAPSWAGAAPPVPSAQAEGESPAPAYGPPPPPRIRSEELRPNAAKEKSLDEREVVVENLRPRPEEGAERAASVVTRKQMQERLPRSAPDALRYEPGVYVQQTGHAQASPYLRGLTGQQTLMQFDGIRLNNSTFRQGPNQYFFTVDSKTIERLEIIRGSASTRYGSDAIGGAMLTTPIEPTLDGYRAWEVHPRVMMATRTADREIGGRAQLDIGWRNKLGVIGGVGYRDVDQLRTAGPIDAPATGEPWKSPRFENDARTQKGTGFREFTSDARVVYRPDRRLRLTAGYYDYRQKDAPRTDRCPPDEAPENECLVYLDQFRTLAYAAVQTDEGPAAAEKMRVTGSFQNQHERRQQTRENGIPDLPGGTESNGKDEVRTYGADLELSTKNFRLAPDVALRVDYGGDIYYDRVASLAWLRFTDIDPIITQIQSRGQYLDGSQYLTSGLWSEARFVFFERFTVRGGGRFAWARANAPGDEESESTAVRRNWVTGVGNAGVGLAATDWLSVHINFDQGYRAPNLDDLSSRQQTGPGFQFENAELEPERSYALEGGLRAAHKYFEANAFVFQTWLVDMIARAPREFEDCPPSENSPGGCGASRTRFQLVNLDGTALVRGFDGQVRGFIPHGFIVSTTLSYAWGEGPNPVPAPPDPDAAQNYEARLPLSRIPPLNGSVELSWHHKRGFWVGSGLRWAAKQDRLALADEADIRIPTGGTPGFAVVDLRAGYRWDPFMLIGLVFENVGNARYRYHGSSVNGPARSLSVSMEFGF